MCVMQLKRVGVRQLRQNLSVYLRRVRRGERLEVTDRGQPVALLVPLPPTAGVIDRLVAAGSVVGPQGDLLALEPAAPLPGVAAALDEVRAERL